MPEFNDVITLAGSIGVSALGAIKFAATKLEIYRKEAKEERELERQERMVRDEKILTQLHEMTKTNQILLETNRELAESQRKLIDEHSVKINNIENTVIVMSEKLSNKLEKMD